MTIITRKPGPPIIRTCPPRRPLTPDEMAMALTVMEVEEIKKHPGGTGHDQLTHGNWARGGDSGIPFDRKGTLRALSVPDRKEAWDALSVKERDAQANPVKTIGDRITEITKPLGDWEDSGDLKADVAARVKKAGDLIPADSARLISDHMKQLADELAASGVDAKLARKITTEATDALIAQDHESLGRTLGDHGARHLMQDADYTMAQLKELAVDRPGLDTPEMRAMAILTAVYHDAGYMTPPSRAFLDEGHPRWSQDFFDAKIRGDIEAAFGKSQADLVSLTIASHDTIRMDWAKRPFSSAFRVSDNLGLFHAEKLPPFMHNVPKNVGVIARLGRDLAQPNADVGAAVRRAQTEARANIEAQPGLSAVQRLRMMDAVEEISPILPKLSLGMVGGKLTGFSWNRDTGTMEATAQRSKEADDISRVVDVGQRQFIKLADTYHVDPASVRQDNRMDFDADGDGSPDFTLFITGQLLKHLMGQHDQKSHGRRGGGAGGHDWGDDKVRAVLGKDALHPEQQLAIDATLAKYDITQEGLDAQAHALAQAVLGDNTQADLDKMPDSWKPQGAGWYDSAATETTRQFHDQDIKDRDFAFQAQVAMAAALSPNLAWDQKSTHDVEGWLRTEHGTVAVNSRLAAVVARSWLNNDEVVITPEMIASEELRGMGLTITTPGTYRLRDIGVENAGAVMGKALSVSPMWGAHTRQMSGQNYAHAFRIAEAARTHSPDLVAVIDRELAGPKVRNFYNALVSRGEWDGGTIDVHMIRGMLPRGSSWPTAGHPAIPYPAVGGSHGRGGTKPSGSTLSSGATALTRRSPLLDASTSQRRDGRGVMVRGQAMTHLEAVSREARAAWLDDAGVYPAFQQALLREARARGMKVSDLQAILWYYIRNGGQALA